MGSVVLYVPGLGDHRSHGQQFAVWLWRLYGVRSEIVRMHWMVAEPFEHKLERLLTRIDKLATDGHKVSLVGVSAGASAVINAYATRQDVVHRVVCICGKLQHAETISPDTYRRNPGFAESMQLLPTNLLRLPQEKRSHILSVRPRADQSVPPKDTIIPGAQTKVIPTAGHTPSIAAAITVYSGSVVRFIKKP